jgi:hypothetical protein
VRAGWMRVWRIGLCVVSDVGQVGSDVRWPIKLEALPGVRAGVLRVCGLGVAALTG